MIKKDEKGQDLNDKGKRLTIKGTMTDVLRASGKKIDPKKKKSEG
jgi:hypothetical protein